MRYFERNRRACLKERGRERGSCGFEVCQSEPVAQRGVSLVNGGGRTDGGRGALRINALIHLKVREIRYQGHIFTATENSTANSRFVVLI